MSHIVLRRNIPLVAIIGRPNVGKSTLFNRLTGTRKAVVNEQPGMTRDRNYLQAEWQGREFMLIDTGGYETTIDVEIYRQMREQTLLAVDEADVIVFLTNVNESSNPIDEEILQHLRKSSKPVILAVNKCDNAEAKNYAIYEYSRYGLTPLVPISALHGNGTGELLDHVVEFLPENDETIEEDLGIRIAVVGRPNVGKSTLVNKILGFERTIANAMPGTTRDSIDTTFQRGDQIYTIIDTAGLRRRGKIERGPEKISALVARRSMERCDIALLLIDADEGITDQDAHVAGYAVDAGCACIIVVNKWDAVEKDHKTADEFTQKLRYEWGFLKDSPVIYISAKTGQRVDKLFSVIETLYEEYTREISTSQVNNFIKKATTKLSPPVRSGRQLKIKYGTQTGIRPPTFTFFVNDPALIHFSYERFLLNQLREEFGFTGTPLRIRFKQKASENPFANKKQEK